MSSDQDLHSFAVAANQSIDKGEVPQTKMFDGHKAQKLDQEFRAMGWGDLPHHKEPYSTTNKIRARFLQSPASADGHYVAFIEGSMLGAFTEVEFGFSQ